MRILTISAQKPDSTGSGVYLAQTVRAFRAAGHEVAVIAGVDADDDPALGEGVLFHPVRYRTPDLPFPVCGMSDQMPYASTRYRDMTPDMVARFEAAFSAAIADVARTFEPDLVICHHLYLVAAVTVEAGLPCPVTAVCHSTDLRQMRSHGLERERIVSAVRALDLVFSLHEAQKREIEDVYGVPAERIRVVGTGYDRTVFREDPNSRTVDRAEVAYVGKISRKKGVESLLRCLDLLSLPKGRLAVRLVGGHSTEDELARMRALAKEARFPVEFAGKVDQDELVRTYQRAHVFVLPSFYEGLPLVVIEALACGCRVVVTDLPGIREWLDESVPGAPVAYVQPPRMVGVDEPVQEDLPAFEQRLARAIERSAQEALQPARCEDAPVDMARLSWNALGARMLELVAATSLQVGAAAL
ncbi:glycosyltransferase family 4 protein [Paraeggerthella sp. Marseille-Q4926]|uniref:glycosyltransferase family 4 protein n=1 Tax=Paraeggerthella sp. Marseille-Q4926 TaxID=2866587 RepID=UPI001CE3C5E1|nr:glycosyltransferase family 4 protein [Paraeggerthella sp. Marseille-Q4926]